MRALLFQADGRNWDSVTVRKRWPWLFYQGLTYDYAGMWWGALVYKERKLV